MGSLVFPPSAASTLGPEAGESKSMSPLRAVFQVILTLWALWGSTLLFFKTRCFGGLVGADLKSGGDGCGVQTLHHSGKI